MADISASRSRMRSTVSMVVLALALGACTAQLERAGRPGGDTDGVSDQAPLDTLLQLLKRDSTLSFVTLD